MSEEQLLEDYKRRKNNSELRNLREKTGLSMAEMARILNTPYRTWQDWELKISKTPGVAIKALELYIENKEPIHLTQEIRFKLEDHLTKITRKLDKNFTPDLNENKLCLEKLLGYNLTKT
jgi:DNA-binding transcriptional regulator YiaG